jgi:NADPH:quinone reductase-like Zn-dependent oxidoreductase
MTETGSRAVLLDRYGEPEVLYVADVRMPRPAEGEVVLEVKAAAINSGEAAIRSGALADRFPTTFCSGEGSDLSGIVSVVGDGVDEFTVGDHVLGFSFRRCSHASYVSVPTSQLIHKT